MISPGRLACKAREALGAWAGLAPFFKAVVVYFCLGAYWAADGEPGAGEGPGAGGGPSGRALAALAKCAPVLALMAFVAARGEAGRGWRVALGLGASAAGDALLVWPQHFVAGMGAFAVAHLLYVGAFRPAPARPLLAAVLYAATALATSHFELRGALAALVPAYAALLATMCWRAWAPLRRGADQRDLAAACGAALFLVSDTVLGFDRFHAPVPHRQLWVMSTYYLAQLGLALSVALPPARPAK